VVGGPRKVSGIAGVVAGKATRPCGDNKEKSKTQVRSEPGESTLSNTSAILELSQPMFRRG
jgi:hypothetical protein